MKPFAGYNFGDYWKHWLRIGSKLSHPPRIFHVNWFRQNAEGKFLWPGFGENLRVLAWVLERCEGRANAVDTPIGLMPRPTDIDTQGLNLPAGTLEELTEVPAEAWKKEMGEFRQYLQGFGARTPSGLFSEVDEVEKRLAAKS
jgi:phosphoenolpyruvate carboxykinase (GTP)